MAARATVVLLALLGSSRVAAASPLVWDAPAGCPDAADVQARIARRLGIDDVVHGVEITVVRTRAGFVAEIDARALTVANDVRTLRSARCDELANAVAVIVARLASEARERSADNVVVTGPIAMAPAASKQVALDAEGGISDDDLAASDAAAAAHNGTTVRRVGRWNGPPSERPPTWGGGVRLTGLSGAGALPSLNLGVELAGYVRRLDRFVELGVGAWNPQTNYLQNGAPAGVEVGLRVLTLRAGWGPRDLPLRAWLTAELGQIQGIGVAVDDPQGGATRWTALGGGFNVQWPMSPLARLVGAVELMIPLERTRFMLADGRDLYQPSSAAARCSLGIEVGWR